MDCNLVYCASVEGYLVSLIVKIVFWRRALSFIIFMMVSASLSDLSESALELQAVTSTLD